MATALATAQLALPGLGPRPTDRLFFAILPDEAARTRSAEIASHVSDECGLAGRKIDGECLHVSLFFLGDYVGLSEDLIAKAMAAGQAVSHASFRVAFDCVGSFVGTRSKRPLVLRNSETALLLAAFRQALGKNLAANGLGRFVTPSHTAHMTLLYDARSVETRAVEPVAWEAREFVLVHSLVGRSKHIVLGRWSFREALVAVPSAGQVARKPRQKRAQAAQG